MFVCVCIMVCVCVWYGGGGVRTLPRVGSAMTYFLKNGPFSKKL